MSQLHRDVRLRVWYSKCNDLRYLGHRDLLRACERWFRRAQLELQFSQGFHPRALMNFPSALAVGIAGEEEVMEVVLVDPPPVDQIETRLRQTGCPGLELLRIECLAPGQAKARIVAAHYAIDIPAERTPMAQAAAQQLWEATTWTLHRDGKESPLDIRPGLLEIRVNNNQVEMRLAVDQSGSVRPREILHALELHDLESQGSVLRRVRVELGDQAKL